MDEKCFDVDECVCVCVCERERVCVIKCWCVRTGV